MLKIAAALLAVLALANGQTTPVSQCIYQSGSLPLNVYIEGCTNPPCQLPQLTDIVVNIVFQAPYTVRRMRTLATAYLFGAFGVPYDLGDEAETCNFLTNTYCPVLQNEVAQYTLRMFIAPFMPVGTSATIEFRIVDENNSAIVCIRAPINIVAPAEGATATRGSNSTLVISTAN